MKIFLFVVCISASIAGCKKGNLIPAGLTGTWELRHYSGTIAGVDKDVPAENGTLIQFKSDGTYARFTDSKQNSQGPYKIVRNSITFGDKKYDGLYLNGGTIGSFIFLKSDTLTIGDTFPDGVTSLYIRK